MKALCWYGKNKVDIEDVPEPELINPHDAIIKVSSTAICGSDLHLYDGFIPTMEQGDILGHEFMGEVVDIGAEVHKLSKGDRVVVPAMISCGSCYFCKHDMWSLCDNSNPNSWLVEKLYGYSPSAIFGYSHMFGGYAGGQAEYVRVPYANVGPFKVEDGISDEQVLFLSDILPTGYMAAENCDIKRGDIVAVWGCGPVGLFAMKSAYLLGASRVIAIDQESERLAKARTYAGAETLDFSEGDVVEKLKFITGGNGPDCCIDAVGLEASGNTLDSLYDNVKTVLYLEKDRSHVLRQAIQACRKGGVISITGVYGGFLDKVNFGAAFSKGLTFRMGQTHIHKYMPILYDKIKRGDIDPSGITTHRLSLDEAPEAYRIFKDKQDDCIKVVLHP